MVAGHAIRAGEERRAELGRHERGGAHVRADVRAHQRAQPDDAPVRVEADLGLVLDLARVVGGHHRLAALLDPPDGAAELHRGERDQHVFRIQLAADAEASAHVHLRQAQRAHGDAEDRGQDGAVDVDALGGADQVQLAPARVGGHGDEAARLERRRRLARIGEALAHDHGGRVERPVDVADAHRDHRDVVGLGAGKEPRCARGERHRHRGARGEGIVDDVDALERVLGHVAVVGHDQRDGLAHVADHSAGDGGLQVPLRSRRGAHAVRDHRGPGHVGGGEHEPHAGQLEGALGVDRDQPGMRMARAQHGGVQHALHADVGHEAARARCEAVAPDAIVRVPDHRCSSAARERCARDGDSTAARGREAPGYTRATSPWRSRGHGTHEAGCIRPRTCYLPIAVRSGRCGLPERRSGEVICGAGPCLRDVNGEVYCAQFRFGSILRTSNGETLCGRGRCVTTLNGEVVCSIVDGGGAIEAVRRHRSVPGWLRVRLARPVRAHLRPRGRGSGSSVEPPRLTRRRARA